MGTMRLVHADKTGWVLLCSVALTSVLVSCQPLQNRPATPAVAPMTRVATLSPPASASPTVTTLPKDTPVVAVAGPAPATIAVAATSGPTGQPQRAGWRRYTSPYVGVSFAYPADWKFVPVREKPDRYNLPYFQLSAPVVDHLGGNIGVAIVYMGSEFAKGGSLRSWVEKYLQMTLPGNPSGYTLSATSEATFVEPNGSLHEMVRSSLADKSGAATLESIFIKQGDNVVIQISSATWTEYAPALRAVLEDIARSFQFSADAPRTLNEMYGVDP
ncbi:MAG: hypothetical protein WAU95_09280 [Anaerolineae bacterium]